MAQNNIPIAPAPPPMLAAPQLIQRPVMLTKFTPTTLPTSQNSIHPVRVVNGQTATIAKTFPMAQLTSIVIATPGTRLAGPQTVQLSKPSLEKQVQAEYASVSGSSGLAIEARLSLNTFSQEDFISAPLSVTCCLPRDHLSTVQKGQSY